MMMKLAVLVVLFQVDGVFAVTETGDKRPLFSTAKKALARFGEITAVNNPLSATTLVFVGFP